MCDDDNVLFIFFPFEGSQIASFDKIDKILLHSSYSIQLYTFRIGVTMRNMQSTLSIEALGDLIMHSLAHGICWFFSFLSRA